MCLLKQAIVNAGFSERIIKSLKTILMYKSMLRAVRMANEASYFSHSWQRFSITILAGKLECFNLRL